MSRFRDTGVCFLVVPGWRNSGPDHWQTRWERQLLRCSRVKQENWEDPSPNRWIANIENAIRASERPVVLIAHSLGCPAVNRLANSGLANVHSAFLVAPPAFHGRTACRQVIERFNTGGLPLPFPSFVVGSENDPYATLDEAQALATAWGSRFVNAGRVGHINVDSGHGPWPAGEELLLELVAGKNQRARRRCFAWNAGALAKAGVCAITAIALGRSEVVIKEQGFVPFGNAPINYRSSKNLADPVAKLQQKLDRDEIKLEYEPGHGYLRSVLKALRIPVSSQTLVFSKTSFQYPYITPESPRALYFNDDVYVGQVHRSKSLEFVSFDPMQGAIFYILDERQTAKPRFERSELDCVQCHLNTTTRGIPGVLVRSVVTAASGFQKAGTPAYTTGHESPIGQRWAGWYVTGQHGQQPHLGNTIVATGKGPDNATSKQSANLKSLTDFINPAGYLIGDSDIVAHLVLAHQTQMHNLITLTNYQVRLALHEQELRNQKEGAPGAPLSEPLRRKFERPAEELVRYLLFVDEAPLEDHVAGTSGFTEEFAALGPRDPQGRSLRNFDLNKRIFKYPCSYLIYSEAFDAIPSPAKEYIYRRLLEILSDRDQSPEFAGLSSQSRRAILEILVATKPGLPETWKQFVESHKLLPAGQGHQAY